MSRRKQNYPQHLVGDGARTDRHVMNLGKSSENDLEANPANESSKSHTSEYRSLTDYSKYLVSNPCSSSIRG